MMLKPTHACQMVLYSKLSRIAVASLSALLSKSGSLSQKPIMFTWGRWHNRQSNSTVDKFSSVQNGISAFRKARMSATPSRKFPCFVFKTVPLSIWLVVDFSRPFSEDCHSLTLSTPLSSRRSVVWCPWLCACMLCIFQDASHLWWLLCLLVCLLSHFPSLLVLHVQGSTSTVFRDGCQTLKHASLCFACHCSLFVASSLNLWGWRHHADQSLVDWACFICFHRDLYGSLSRCLPPLYDVIEIDSTILFLWPLSVFRSFVAPV